MQKHPRAGQKSPGPTFYLFACIVLGVTALFFIIPNLRKQAENQEMHILSGFTMGTSYTVLLPEFPDAFSNAQLATEIQARLDRLDQGLMSPYAPDSELSRFNRTDINQPFPVSRELLEVITIAQEVYQLSEGAFDITISPLVRLWGFGPGFQSGQIPSKAQIDQAKSMLASDELKFSHATSSLVKEKPLELDLSGIAKGYAVDELARWFDALGIADYLIEIGGELKTKGYKSGQDSWIAAIESPDASSQQVFLSINTHGQTLAIAGSGDYRIFFEVEGKRYSHEIDPKTGWPIDHNLVAVTIVSPSATRADALATALIIMGPEAGYALARNLGLAALFIVQTDDGLQSIHTPELTEFIR